MPSARRIRLLTLAAVGAVMLFLYYSTGIRRGPSSHNEFYRKTIKAMQGQSPLSRGDVPVVKSGTAQQVGRIRADGDGDGDGGVDEDDVRRNKELQERLSRLAKEANEKANEKAGPKPDAPSKLVGVGNSAKGNRKPADEVAKGAGEEKGSPAEPSKAATAASTGKEMEAEKELHRILEEAPVIIFSKSYCPYSKRAKGILVEKYTITPKIHVEELDKHPLMNELQNLLEVLTQRRTVPNIMVNGVSIGGADEIIELDHKGELMGKIREVSKGKVEVTEFSTEAKAKAAAL